MELTAVKDIRVYLLSDWEFNEKLEGVLNECLEKGASETSTIGPWILFEACDHEELAFAVVRNAVKKVTA